MKIIIVLQLGIHFLPVKMKLVQNKLAACMHLPTYLFNFWPLLAKARPELVRSWHGNERKLQERTSKRAVNFCRQRLDWRTDQSLDRSVDPGIQITSLQLHSFLGFHFALLKEKKLKEIGLFCFLILDFQYSPYAYNNDDMHVLFPKPNQRTDVLFSSIWHRGQFR